MSDAECTICGNLFNPEEGGIEGHFHIKPVSFCTWCIQGMKLMAFSSGWCDELEEE